LKIDSGDATHYISAAAQRMVLPKQLVSNLSDKCLQLNNF